MLLGKPDTRKAKQRSVLISEESHVSPDFQKSSSNPKVSVLVTPKSPTTSVLKGNVHQRTEVSSSLSTEDFQLRTKKDECTEKQDDLQINRKKPHKSGTSKESELELLKIQEEILDSIKKGEYKMEIAPSDLIDFGGQRSFDMTHQLFIQNKGSFVLMVDGRYNIDELLKEYKQGNITSACKYGIILSDRLLQGKEV